MECLQFISANIKRYGLDEIYNFCVSYTSDVPFRPYRTTAVLSDKKRLR